MASIAGYSLSTHGTYGKASSQMQNLLMVKSGLKRPDYIVESSTNWENLGKKFSLKIIRFFLWIAEDKKTPLSGRGWFPRWSLCNVTMIPITANTPSPDQVQYIWFWTSGTISEHVVMTKKNLLWWQRCPTQRWRGSQDYLRDSQAGKMYMITCIDMVLMSLKRKNPWAENCRGRMMRLTGWRRRLPIKIWGQKKSLERWWKGLRSKRPSLESRNREFQTKMLKSLSWRRQYWDHAQRRTPHSTTQVALTTTQESVLITTALGELASPTWRCTPNPKAAPYLLFLQKDMVTRLLWPQSQPTRPPWLPHVVVSLTTARTLAWCGHWQCLASAK